VKKQIVSAAKNAILLFVCGALVMAGMKTVETLWRRPVDKFVVEHRYIINPTTGREAK